MAKKKYVDDDIREELKSLTGVSFESEEELQKKLEEIHRKKNEKAISRIMRVCGFVFALILFIASFDVFFERSLLGAWFDKNAYNMAKMYDQSVIEISGPISTEGYIGVRVLDADNNVLTDFGTETISKGEFDRTKTEALLAGNSITYDCEIYKYIVRMKDKNLGIYHWSLETKVPNLEKFKTTEEFELFVKETNSGLAAYRDNWNQLNTIKAGIPTSELFDDEFYLGYGMSTVLSTVVLLALATLLAFLSAYMVKDIIDVTKGFFYGSRDVVTNVAETAVAPFKKTKKTEKPEESERTSKSLFDDEDVPEKKPTTRKKKSDAEKPETPERHKDEEDYSTLLTEDELDALLNPDSKSNNAD
jgi:hypothetical protein